jgi:hypothetical protein
MHYSSPQVFNNAAEEGASFLDYDAEECETGLDALFHDMSNTERNGSWLRTWCGVLHCEALTGCRACRVGCEMVTPAIWWHAGSTWARQTSWRSTC